MLILHISWNKWLTYCIFFFFFFFFSDLSKLGGLSVLIRQLNHPDTDIRKISAWILGKASQNNPLVQKQVHYYFFFIYKGGF